MDMEDMEVEKAKELEDQTVIPEVIDDLPKMLTGHVSGCKKLNVRELPTIAAKILCEITEGSELMIDSVDTTDSFYRVVLPSGLEGYCVKEFITINE